MKKSFLSVVSLLLLFTTVLVACTNKTAEKAASVKPSATTSASAAPSAPAGNVSTLPIVPAGSVTLSYGAPDNAYAPKSLTQGVPVWTEIEKNTRVKINWEVTPPAQYADAMKIRLAAGKNLPDIVALPIGVVEAASQGLIIPLDDLIAQYAPDIMKYFKEFPALKSAMTNPDGKIYGLGTDVSGSAFGDPYGLFVRQDWLDKLNLQQPKTLDDWYKVLKAFKEQDPNGHNKADEIPLSPNSNIRGLGLFGSALGLHLYFSEGYYPNKDGKVQYEWMDERAHQLIIWLNKLYSEGLIDPQFMTNTDTEVTSSITRNLVGVTNYFTNNTNRYNAAQKAAGVNSVWQITLPPSGDGYPGFYEKYGPIDGFSGITKNSKNPEVAIKWLNYVYGSEEGERYLNFGIEGKSYTMVNGEPQFTDWTAHNPEGLSFNEALRSLGAMPYFAWIRASSGPLSKQMPAILALDPYLKKQVEKIKPTLIDSFLYMSGLPTLKETQESAKLMPDIKTYQDETLAKFIMGQSPIDWDKFVSTLKSLGIDKIIKEKQAQYDRFQQSK